MAPKVDCSAEHAGSYMTHASCESVSRDTVKMATRDLMDLSAPMHDSTARRTQRAAITRDYISQPRLSE